MKPYYQDEWVTIYHGDCREILPSLDKNNCPRCHGEGWYLHPVLGGDYEKALCQHPEIDLVIADPPYETTKEHWDKDTINMEFSEIIFNIVKDSASLYVWCGIGELSQSIIRWFPIFNHLWHFKDLITWKKSRGHGTRRGWLITREEIMWFVKDNKKFVWNSSFQYSDELRTFTATYKDKIKLAKYNQSVKSPYKRFTNVWTDIREPNIGKHGKEVHKRGTWHYTPKPMKAINRIIEIHTEKNNLILDPFLGSGTTAHCAKQLNRKCIGIEIEEEYCEMAAKRCSQSVMTLNI